MTDRAMAGNLQKHVVISARAIRPGAGSSRIVLALVRGLSDAGHRVEVVADRIDEAAVRRAGGTPRYPLGSSLAQSLARRLLGRERQAALRERAVGRRRADLVIGEGDLRRQHVLLVHNIARREAEELGAAATAEHERAAVRQERALRGNAYDLVIANSELTRSEFTRCFGFPAGRIAVAWPGYDPAQFSRQERERLRGPLRRSLGVSDAEVLVAFVSSGHFILRGIDVLAATFARLAPDVGRRVRLLCVGSDRNAELLRAEFARLGLDQPVIAAPRSDDVQSYYHAADLLFHPAHFETFGLVVIEAAACGCPVLTSRSVGAAELLQDSLGAAVVARPDATLFAPLLERLVAEPALRTAIADGQYLAVRANTWPVYTGNVISVLRARGLL